MRTRTFSRSTMAHGFHIETESIDAKAIEKESQARQDEAQARNLANEGNAKGLHTLPTYAVFSRPSGRDVSAKGAVAMAQAQVPPAEEQVPPCEIEAPDLDAEKIMQQIRARIRARRAQSKARGLDLEAYADGLYPLPPGAVFSRELYESVRYVSVGYDKVNVAPALTETRLPVIGGLVQRLRANLHTLVLFYVNRMAAQQIHFNEQVTRSLAAMVKDLETEVRDLRDRLAELEGDQA